MASITSSNTQDQVYDLGYDHDQAEEHTNPTPTPSPQPRDQSPNQASPPGPKHPESTENRLRPAADIINRIIWDTTYNSADYLIGYEDRFSGRLETGLGSWKKDLTDEEFIPQHRILYIRRKSDGEVVWDRRRRVDRVFWSGNSGCRYLDFLS